MENRYYLRKNKYCTVLPVLLGNLLGSIFILMVIAFLDVVVPEQGIENYNISVLLNLPGEELLLHVMKRRGLQILLFFILSFLLSYPVAAFCYNGFLGIYYGMITSDLLIKFGLRGVLYSFFCFFPHYLFYFFSIFLGGYWFYYEGRNYSGGYENVNKTQKIFKIFVIFTFVFLAVIWEMKFQKFFLNYFYQYLV